MTILALTGVPARLSDLTYCWTFPSTAPRVSGLPRFFFGRWEEIFCSGLILLNSALYCFLNSLTMLSPRVLKCLTVAVLPHLAAYFVIFALCSDVKWVYFRFRPFAPFRSSSKTLWTTTAFVITSPKPVSLLLGRDWHGKYMYFHRPAIILNRLISLASLKRAVPETENNCCFYYCCFINVL